MKFYYTQEKIASSLRNFFSIFSISKPHLKSLSYIIIGMISAESVVTSDFARKLKDSFSPFAYSFYESFISHIISLFSIKHSNIHISFDHMFCKDKFTILLFSLRIGKQRYTYLVSMF